MLETILRERVNTRELLPSQRRRLRELQLPDGTAEKSEKCKNSFF